MSEMVEFYFHDWSCQSIFQDNNITFSVLLVFYLTILKDNSYRKYIEEQRNIAWFTDSQIALT